jgi:hypothetical protein
MGGYRRYMDHLLSDIDAILKQQSIQAFSKKDLESFLKHTLNLEKQRSVFTSNSHSFRVSEVRGGKKGFSNVVLSLSALLKYDDKPFVVIVVRDNSLEFLLSNTAFLKKISHSSHTLSENNIKGSFLGQDIFENYNEMVNTVSNFKNLFELHRSISLSENIQRLVNSTNSIVAKNNRYEPNEAEIASIMLAPCRYKDFFESDDYKNLEVTLCKKIELQKSNILQASEDQNINTRGNAIEQIITEGSNGHKTEDFIFEVSNQVRILIDIKTKLNHLSSNPKAFNIDKILKILSNKKEIFCFLILVIDVKRQCIESRLIPILATEFISMLRVQHHWAGRKSRGVTQMSGNINSLVDKQNSLSFHLNTARTYLHGLLDI